MGNLRSLGCFGRLREEDKSDRKNQEHRNDKSLEGSHCVNFRNTWSNGCEWGSYMRHETNKVSLGASRWLIRAYFFPHT